MTDNGKKENIGRHRRSALERIQEICDRSRQRLIRTLGGNLKTGIEQMSERSIRDGILNTVLTSYLMREVRKHGNVEDDLKLQKLVFLAEKNMIERGLKGFSYNFFRWRKGPYSGPLKNNLHGLISNGLVKPTPKGFELTEHGEEMLKQCQTLLDENARFTEIVDDVARTYGPLSPDEIKKVVYEMSIFVPRIRKVMVIGEIKEGQLILCRISDKKADHIFDFDDSWQATLELMLDSRALGMLHEAREDARHGRVSRSIQTNPTKNI